MNSPDALRRRAIHSLFQPNQPSRSRWCRTDASRAVERAPPPFARSASCWREHEFGGGRRAQRDGWGHHEPVTGSTRQTPERADANPDYHLGKRACCRFPLFRIDTRSRNHHNGRYPDDPARTPRRYAPARLARAARSRNRRIRNPDARSRLLRREQAPVDE
jgi:hypothetical protein